MTRRPILRATALAALALFGACNQVAGIQPGEPLGTPVACEKDSDCPAAAEPECGSLAGCQGGTCAYATELDGTPLMAQTAGDCSQRVCDGKGGVRLTAFDADVEDDGLPCTLDTCEGGLAKHTPQQQLPCYSGAMGTAGIGLCKEGVQHCDSNFQPIGGCEGEVVPQAESCLTPGDEDCNGQTNEAGDGCVCTPDAVSPCYEGPMGTADVGICKLGTCLCNGAGTSCVSSCNGQVLPAAEDCATPDDENCDGVAWQSPVDNCTIVGDDDCDGTSIDACTGALGWVKASTTTGSSNNTRAGSIATDAAGNLYAAGTVYKIDTTIDLGGGPLTPPNNGSYYAAFVVKLAPDGTHLWSKLLPCADTGDYQIPRVAVAAGQVVLAYTVDGYACDFGSGSPVNTSGIVLIRLDGGTGTFVSNTTIGTSGSYIYALGAGSSSVYLAGYQYGTGTIGFVWLSNQPFVAKVDGNNSVLWAKGFELSSSSYAAANRVTALAVLPDDSVAFAGNAVQSTIDLGAGPQGNASKFENQYFGVLDPAGSLRWGKVFTPSSSSPFPIGAPSALAIAPNGDVIALGRTYGGFQLGMVAIGSGEGYLGLLAAADGAVGWAKALKLGSTNNPPALYSLSVDPLGHIGIGSYLYSGADLGGGPVPQEGNYITKLDGTGAHLWTKAIPLYYNTNFRQPLIAPAKDAGVLFTGKIDGVQSFDGTLVGQPSYYEAVFGKLAP